MSQYNISRLEKRQDMLLSTLNAYIEGLGGTLQIVAKIPGEDDVVLDISGPAGRKKPRKAA